MRVILVFCVSFILSCSGVMAAGDGSVSGVKAKNVKNRKEEQTARTKKDVSRETEQMRHGEDKSKKMGMGNDGEGQKEDMREKEMSGEDHDGMDNVDGPKSTQMNDNETLRGEENADMKEGEMEQNDMEKNMGSEHEMDTDEMEPQDKLRHKDEMKEKMNMKHERMEQGHDMMQQRDMMDSRSHEMMKDEDMKKDGMDGHEHHMK